MPMTIGKFVEHAPDHAAHEEHRDEDRHQRDRHRDDGEGDLARALESGLHGVHAGFDVADDVLEHHDRVVDHETDRKRERHQRNIVERVAAEIHGRKGADDRHRQGQRRNDRCRQPSNEQEDDEHDQDDGEDQRVLHVGDRRL